MPITAALSTSDLVATCRAAGLDVSHTKVRDWRRKGLLPKSKRGPGRGQGKGKEPAFWDPSCVERCRIIDASLITHPGSLDRAAEALFANGYWIWNERVHRYLETLADLADTAVKNRRRKFLENENSADTALRLDKSVERRHSGISREFLSIMKDSVTGMAGLCHQLPNSPYAKLADYLSPTSIKNAVNQLTERQLEDVHQNAKNWVRNVLVLAEICLFGTLALDRSKSPSAVEGPTLQFAGIPAIKTYRTDASTAEPKDAQLKLQMAALMVNVIVEVHGMKFKIAVLKVVARYIWTVVMKDATGKYRKVLKSTVQKIDELPGS